MKNFGREKSSDHMIPLIKGLDLGRRYLTGDIQVTIS